MTDAEFLATLVDKGGLPGVIAVALMWGMYRFGLRPTGNPVSNETAAAIEKLAGKMDGVSNQVSQIDRRLIRVETKMEDRR